MIEVPEIADAGEMAGANKYSYVRNTVMDQRINCADIFIIAVVVMDTLHSDDENQTGIDARRYSVAGQTIGCAYEMDIRHRRIFL